MNPNVFIWVSDWHVGRQSLASMQAMAQHLVDLAPAGVIDTGDCKEHPGVASAPELDDYVAAVLDVVPWAPCVGVPQPVLPGNHDEIADYGEAAPTDFSLFDAALWPAPYHWRADWVAPKIRFLAFHTELVHPPSNLAGFARVDVAEVQWLEAELAALPEGWQAIVCSHFPAAIAFGNQIRGELGGSQLLSVLSTHSARVAAYLNGHRHANMNTNVLDGITHFNGPGVAYTQGNGNGGFVPIDYDPAARTLTFSYHYARPPFAAFAGYTPVVIKLPGEPEPTRDEKIVAEMKQTTVGYKNKYWVEPPVGTHWRNVLDLLEV